jgi:hypothetical protein
MTRRLAVLPGALVSALALLGAGPTVPPPPAGSGAGAQGLVWTAPPGWTAQPPSTSMRRAQYSIAGPGGHAECVVFYFGPGQGGDARANAARWASQFHGAGGAPAASATREVKVGALSVLVVEVTGTYVGGMGGGPTGPAQADYMLLGAIVPGPDANWFFRAVGPRATLAPQKAGFERMIHSIKRGG